NNGINVTLSDFPTTLTIECRRVQISQVLINILNNAFAAVLGHPEKSVKLHVHDSGDMVEISISNSGPQIPPELAHKIFQPFFTTKGVGKGTGLGLSISKGLIENHGGDISLDLSAPETRFVIVLPKRQRRKTDEPSPGDSSKSPQ
ncbi:HAMP domain-containing histidine kinase, partial [bacterium]